MNATVFLDPSLNQEMEEEIRLLNTKLDYFEGNLLSAKSKIKTLDDKNKALKYRLTLEKAEIENLQNRISQLEAEKTGLQSEWSQYQKEMTNKVRDLTNESQNFRNAFDSCQSKQKLDCEKDGLSSRAKGEDSDKFDESSIVIIIVIT